MFEKPHNIYALSGFARPAAPSLSDVAALVPPPDLPIERPAKPVCSQGLVSVYLAGSGALREIAKKLGVYVLKVGITEGNPQTRTQQLAKNRYAGLWGHREALVMLPGADQWKLFRLRNDPIVSHEFAALSPYGHIDVRVPPTVKRELVDAAVNVVLERRSFQSFLRSDEGRVRCQRAKIDPSAWFWSAYPGRDPAPVEELFLIDPSRDGPWLLDAMDALGRHLHR